MRDFILAAMENYNHSPHLRFLEIEWKIRRALGQVVPIEVIDVSRSRLVSRLLVGYISDLNGLSPSAVELLIAKAEGLTVADRYEPLTALEHDETGVVIEGVTLSDR